MKAEKRQKVRTERTSPWYGELRGGGGRKGRRDTPASPPVLCLLDGRCVRFPLVLPKTV